MRLNSVLVRANSDTISLVGEVESGRQSQPFELYFSYPIEYKEFVGVSADPFAVAMLIPAMIAGESLQIVPPLSPRLHFHLGRVRDIFHSWHPGFTRSNIKATPGEVEPTPLPNRTATFFSGGVDSFYTLLKYRGQAALPAPLTHIIFMRGLEKPLDFLRGVEASQQLVETIAAAAGVRCIVGESNLRTYFDADWLKIYSGSALAATALSLAGGFSHVCIPSTYSYRDQVPTGTTPLVDERYSTERVQVVHDGAELARPEKLRRILEWDRELVLNRLRVCVMNYGGAYNCCACRKCVRTMVPMQSLGVFKDASTFPNKSTSHWEEYVAGDPLPFVEENLEFARAHNGDPALAALLEQIVLRRRRKQALRTLLLNSPLHGLLPVIVGTRRRLHGLRERLATASRGPAANRVP
ncbi:MAG: hypothetical protein ACREUZ_21415 [Burkholderiales bacterium]